MNFSSVRLNRVFGAALAGLAIASAGPALAQDQTIDQEGFLTPPVCEARDSFVKTYLTKKGHASVGVKAQSSSSGTIELFATGQPGDDQRAWVLVGDKNDGKLCFLNGGRSGYPDRVVTRTWFKKYFEPQLGQTTGTRPTAAAAPTMNGTVLALTPSN